MKNIWIPVLWAILLWNACTPVELPNGVQEDPVFFVDMFTPQDSQRYQWVAGLNDQYLFTQVGISDVIGDTVLQASGVFSDRLCPVGNCPNSLRFEFLNNTFESFINPAGLFESSADVPYRFEPNFDMLQTVAIEWVTGTGQLFRSDLLMQEDSTFIGQFLIESSEPWEPNERGEPTWKMTVNFQCLVQNPQTQEIKQIQGQGVIRVGY